MEFLPVLATAMGISLMVIPFMIRHAVRLGLIDEPDSRKVHHLPVPRVGGTGIVLGALIPVALVLRDEPLMMSYLFGSCVLSIFGLWDDRKELGHYAKFLGQFIAVIPLVYLGGLYVEHFPLFDNGAVSPGLAKLFTVFALVGMINAMNHSDGLDGLAGGEALLSLGVLGSLFYLSGDISALVVVAATVGAIVGFLRYNTHPAGVFMGDSGSQFLGFTIGFLMILLTQRADPSLSPAVVLLIVGLPIADILVVFWKRATSGNNWFRASRNHVHHRLLQMGFLHHEAVVLIYSVQLLFVAAAIWLRHGSDLQVLAVYLGGCLLLFWIMNMAEMRDWRFEPVWRREQAVAARDSTFMWKVQVPRRILEYGIPLYLFIASIRVGKVPVDAAIAATALFAILLVVLLGNLRLRSQIRSGLMFAVSILVVYLGQGEWRFHSGAVLFEEAVLIIFAICIALAIRYCPRRRRREFLPTAMDFLIVAILGLVVIAEGSYFRGGIPGISGVALATAVLFYGCEFIITERREPRHLLDIGGLLAMGALMVKGLLLHL